MSNDLIAAGDRAFIEEEFDTALQAYTKAVKLDRTNARVHDALANTRLKLEQWIEASEDASRAIQLDPSFGKAYLRKGTALFQLEEYEAAKEVFEAGQARSGEAAFKTWIRKCAAELEDEAAATGPAQQQQTQQQQQQSQPQPSAPSVPPTSPGHAAAVEASASPAVTSSSAQAADAASQPLAPAALPVQEKKYRHQHYQLQNKVTVDVYAKNLKPEQVSVTFQPTHLTIRIVDSDGQEEYLLDVELYGKVDVAACRYEVLKTKLEVVMTKAEVRQWPTLESSSQIAALNYSQPADAPRTYPSSYVKAPKDWSKVDTELAEMEKKGDLDEGDPLNNFFKKIFGQGDDDQRRAMMKSFTESNGTVLSTNWQDVGKKKVECTPPDGMEVKTWNEK